MSDQDLSRIYGPDGPLGKLSSLNGWVLFLGVDFRSATSVHCAEDQMDLPYLWRDNPMRYKVARDEWKELRKSRNYGCSSNFNIVLPVLESRCQVITGKVGSADVYLVRHSHIVDAALSLLGRDKTVLLCDEPDCD